MRVACSELPPAHPSRSRSLSKLQEKERTLGRGAFFLSVERLLTREEREADQDADQVGSATAETVRVVGFTRVARRRSAKGSLSPNPAPAYPECESFGPGTLMPETPGRDASRDPCQRDRRPAEIERRLRASAPRTKSLFIMREGEELEWVGRFDPVRYLGFLTIGQPGLSQIRYGLKGRF
jgi:hypothetical protein